MQTKEYRTQRKSIHAVQVTVENMEEVAAWCGGAINGAFLFKPEGRTISVPGSSEAGVGDFILTYEGEFITVEEYDFHGMYDEVLDG